MSFLTKKGETRANTHTHTQGPTEATTARVHQHPLPTLRTAASFFLCRDRFPSRTNVTLRTCSEHRRFCLNIMRSLTRYRLIKKKNVNVIKYLDTRNCCVLQTEGWGLILRRIESRKRFPSKNLSKILQICFCNQKLTSANKWDLKLFFGCLTW